MRHADAKIFIGTADDVYYMRTWLTFVTLRCIGRQKVTVSSCPLLDMGTG